MSRFAERRVTNPPRVLPLLPIAFVGILVAGQALDVLAGASRVAQLPFEGGQWFDLSALAGAESLVLELALDLVLLVIASLVLRRLVRRWVVAQPPEPPRAGR